MLLNCLCYNIFRGDNVITMRNIIREGHPNLYKVSKPVRLPLSKGDKRLATELLEFVANSQDEEISEKYQLRAAVGLAAPQINILKQMFAVHFVDQDNNNYSFTVINPEIISKSEQMIYLPGGEGCLSVDRDTYGLLTPRHQEITIHFWAFNPDRSDLVEMTLELKNYPAIVFQHEYDHLNGILFTEKMFSELANATPVWEIEDESLD